MGVLLLIAWIDHKKWFTTKLALPSPKSGSKVRDGTQEVRVCLKIGVVAFLLASQKDPNGEMKPSNSHILIRCTQMAPW